MNNLFRVLVAVAVVGFSLSSCYKLDDPKPNFEDQVSKVVYDLPGDTLATDGWDDNYEPGDLYLRQRYYNSRWTDSIRFRSTNGELINAATGVNSSSDQNIKWLSNATTHPSTITENDAYRNTADGHSYIYRSNVWYQMDIEGELGIAKNDSIAINWRGYVDAAPTAAQTGWAYRDNNNNRVYEYNGKAWKLMVNDANYNANNDFIQVEYSKSGKEARRYSLFLFRFRDGWQQFIRDAADSAKYLKTADWDIAFAGEMNGTVYLNNGLNRFGPGAGSPVTKSSLMMYEYGYDFMNEAPEDVFFDSRPAESLQIGYKSQYGNGVNSWYEYGSTFIAKPYPYRAYYLRLEQVHPTNGAKTIRYGKLQLISLYKGAPEVLTDRNWPAPYLTFKFFIQADGSRNLKTKN
ncbi:MAG: hypothetical protein EOO42_01425 [Flavobacteriales bacterium]|nr:MAG: hypothetical protein EOO42_01425 [Flavobacteriales bacterium]